MSHISNHFPPKTSSFSNIPVSVNDVIILVQPHLPQQPPLYQGPKQMLLRLGVRSFFVCKPHHPVLSYFLF